MTNTHCKGKLTDYGITNTLLVLALVMPGAVLAQQQAGVSAEQLAKANNPLADLNGLNFQNYYASSLYGVPNAVSNTMNLRGVVVTGRQVVRATLPISTVPGTGSDYESGFGDFNIFDAIVLTRPDASIQIGIGPQFVIPTASHDALGSGKWQIGAALVAIHSFAGGTVVGGLITWQTDFAGDDDRQGTNLGVIQPSVTMSIGGGYYVRSTALWLFDFENDRYLIPFGFGVGKVFPAMGALVNAFVEPQFSVYHQGEGQPAVQIAAGMNLQWAKGAKH